MSKVKIDRLVNMTIKEHPDLTLTALHVFSADLCQLLSKVAVRLQLGPPNKAVEDPPTPPQSKAKSCPSSLAPKAAKLARKRTARYGRART